MVERGGDRGGFGRGFGGRGCGGDKVGAKVSVNLMEENQVEAYHENERQAMHKILDKYIRTCERAGVRAEKLWIEINSIEKGIVQLISEHGIKWLGMGAAANKSYSRYIAKYFCLATNRYLLSNTSHRVMHHGYNSIVL
ncbi:hypothetical protein ACS0TY_013914 [Phlomoides rotata]